MFRIYMGVYMYIYMGVYMYIYGCIYVYIWVYLYIYTTRINLIQTFEFRHWVHFTGGRPIKPNQK